MLSNKCNTIIVSSVGVVVLVTAACVGWIAFPDIVTSQVVIKEGNAVYDVWLDPAASVPVTMKFYLFNITNPGSVFDDGSKAVLTQHGPYVYRESRLKTVFETQNGEITYIENITYFYDEEATSGSMDDLICGIDPIFFSVLSLISDIPKYSNELSEQQITTISNLVVNTLRGEGFGPFMCHPVEQLLFEGWQLQGYLDALNKIIKNPIVVGILNILGIEIPDIPETLPSNFQTFGYFSTKNGTAGGNFTIESGLNNLSELGFIKSWNGKPNIDAWGNGDLYCNMINGTDGTLYPPGIDTSERIYLFNTDLCRSIYGTYSKDTDVFGITAHRFTIPEEVFDSAAPENLCFCRDPENCFPKGVLDMRQCLFGIPLVMSTPHFLDGDDRLWQAFGGLLPIRDLHETHFDLEPATSAAVNASKRIQLNLDVRKYFVGNSLEKLNDTIFPVLWVDEGASLDQTGADELKALLGLVYGVNVGRWVFLSCGIALTVAGIVMIIVFTMKH